MMLIKPEDIFHKAQLLRLLTAIVDTPSLSLNLYFKGGTCAAMLGYLDRFSLDLDFDLKRGADKTKLRGELRKLFRDQNFQIENEGKEGGQRNTLKLSIFDLLVKANIYRSAYLPEIDRLANCQTIETMFANKLVTPIDRYAKHEKIAGRDIYDIHYFFSQGYSFREEIIKERTGLETKSFFQKLADFVETKVTGRVLSEDLNMLLPSDRSAKIGKVLKSETLLFLRQFI